MSRKTLASKYRNLGELVAPQRSLEVMRRAGSAITEDGQVAPSATRSNAPLIIVPFYVAGAQVAASNKAIEYRVPQRCRVLRYDVMLKSGPSGGNTSARLTKNGVAQTTMTITAGNTSTDLAPQTVVWVAGDIIRLDVTATAPTPGTDLTFLVTIQPDIAG